MNLSKRSKCLPARRFGVLPLMISLTMALTACESISPVQVEKDEGDTSVRSLASVGFAGAKSGVSYQSGNVGLAYQYDVIVRSAQASYARAMSALDHANTFTCAAAAPYRAAAQAAADQATAERRKLDQSPTIEAAGVIRDAVNSAAAEATRNAHLAEQACGGSVPPEHIYRSPFDNQPGAYPDWNDTFWDISSP